jgi:hypothetical protein
MTKGQMKRDQVMRLAAVLLLCAGIAISTGCASIVSKTYYPVMVMSDPDGATVTIRNKNGDDIRKITTPATVNLSARGGYLSPAHYTFLYECEGYFPATKSLPAVMDNWYFGNIVFGGAIGILIVDPVTGAMWKLDDTVIGILESDPDFKPIHPSTISASDLPIDQ